MQRRLFVGISIPDDIKKRIFRVVEKELHDLPATWGDKKNYHVTLDFLGFVREDKIPEICEAIRNATDEHESFEVEFLRIESGPSQESKRLIWVTGKEKEELSRLKSKLDQFLGSSPSKRKKYVPHITLARIKRGSEEAQYPWSEVGKEIFFSLPVYSVELFESRFEKGKREYCVLQSFPLSS